MHCGTLKYTYKNSANICTIPFIALSLCAPLGPASVSRRPLASGANGDLSSRLRKSHYSSPPSAPAQPRRSATLLLSTGNDILRHSCSHQSSTSSLSSISKIRSTSIPLRDRPPSSEIAPRLLSPPFSSSHLQRPRLTSSRPPTSLVHIPHPPCRDDRPPTRPPSAPRRTSRPSRPC